MKYCKLKAPHFINGVLLPEGSVIKEPKHGLGRQMVSCDANGDAVGSDVKDKAPVKEKPKKPKKPDGTGTITVDDLVEAAKGIIADVGDKCLTSGGSVKKAFLQDELGVDIPQAIYLQYTREK